ncbi:MAG: phage adaptor protein [Candidatus Thorarchaeota archaeon]
MATTVNALAQEIATEFGEEYTDQDVADQFRTWVKEVVRRVIASGRWFSQNAVDDITTVASTATYTLDSTTSEVKAIRLTATDKPIIYTPVERLIAKDYNLETTGPPTNWWIDSLDASQNIVIRFYPVPDAVYDIDAHVLKRPPTLGDSDSIPLPIEYIDVVRDGVRWKVRYNENNLEAAGLALQEFKEGIMILNAKFGSQPRQGSNLPVKLKLKQIHQSGASNDGG